MGADTVAAAAPSRFRFAVVAMGVTLAAVYATLALWSAFSMSETVDERGQLDLGLRLLESRNFEDLVAHGTPPIPVLATAWLPARLVPGDNIGSIGFLHLRRALNILFFGLPLVSVLFVALYRARGPHVAAIGTALLALSPQVLAHSALATTDICATFLFFAALLGVIALGRSPGLPRLAVVAGSIGLAFAAKQSALALIPVLALSLWTATAGGPRIAGIRNAARVFGLVALAVTVAGLVAWAAYGFHVTTLTSPAPWRPKFTSFGDDPFSNALRFIGNTVPLPAPLVSLVVQFVHNHLGHWTYFAGETRMHGTSSYWPALLLLKSSAPELALIAVAIWRVASARVWRDPELRLAATALVFVVIGCLSSNLNIGTRYLLPAYPVAILLVFGAPPAQPSTLSARASVALVAIQAFTAFAVAPHFLTFFNGLIIRPEHAHRIIADSNLDWGQDLPRLAERLESLGPARTTLASWQYLEPKKYGLDCASWWTASAESILDSKWLAVSASVLRNAHGDGNSLSRHFQSLEPDTYGGWSILVFSMARPEVRHAVEAALRERP